MKHLLLTYTHGSFGSFEGIGSVWESVHRVLIKQWIIHHRVSLTAWRLSIGMLLEFLLRQLYIRDLPFRLFHLQSDFQQTASWGDFQSAFKAWLVAVPEQCWRQSQAAQMCDKKRTRPCAYLRCSSSSHVAAAVFFSRASCYLARLEVQCTCTHGPRKRAHFIPPAAGKRRGSPCGVRPNMRTNRLLAWSSHPTVDPNPSLSAAALYSCMCTTERCRREAFEWCVHRVASCLGCVRARRGGPRRTLPGRQGGAFRNVVDVGHDTSFNLTYDKTSSNPKTSIAVDDNT